MLNLLGNPEDRFSQDAAHIMSCLAKRSVTGWTINLFMCFIVHVYIFFFSLTALTYFLTPHHIVLFTNVSVFSDSAIRRLLMVKLQTCNTDDH